MGLLYPARDPISPDNWSGTPKGLATGFAALGYEVVPIPYHLPPGAQQVVAAAARVGGRRGPVARRSPVAAAVRSAVLRRSFVRAGRLAGLVAMQTDTYDLSRVLAGSQTPVATYDDGTFAQFVRHEHSDLRLAAFPDAEVRSWADRQGIACRLAGAACVSTSYGAGSMVEDYGVRPERVHVVGMGHRPRQTDTSRRDWSTPRFLFVGVDWVRKNGDNVLRAFAQLRLQHPAATLDVVGGHPPITQAGVTGHGFLARTDPAGQQRLDGLFEQATAFVLPSRFDPSPIAYLEAASCGLPVIATTEGGAHELLGEAALTVHPDDQPGLVRAMLELANGPTAERLGAAALVNSRDSSWLAVSGRIAQALGLHPVPVPTAAG